MMSYTFSAIQTLCIGCLCGVDDISVTYVAAYRRPIGAKDIAWSFFFFHRLRKKGESNFVISIT